MSETNFQLQSSETSLLAQLSDSVSRKEHDNVVEELEAAEKDHVLVNNETRRLKESTDVLASQLGVLRSQNANLSYEVLTLKEHISDFESKIPEKEVLGKLYRRIVKHSIAETNANQAATTANQKLKKTEADRLKLLKFFDLCDNSSFCRQVEAVEKIRELQSIISGVRSEFASSVPLVIHEKAALRLQFAGQEKERLKAELDKVIEGEASVRGELEQAKARLSLFEETMGDEDRWNDYDVVKLENTRRKRKIEQLERQMQNMLGDFSTREQMIRELEEENAKLIKDSLLRRHSAEDFEIILRRFFNVDTDLREDSLGVTRDAPKEEVQRVWSAEKDRTVRELEKVCELGRPQKLRDRKTLLEKTERDVLSRDELIAQLRIRLLEVEDPSRDRSGDTKQVLEAALLNIESLKKCLAARDETVRQLRCLLAESDKLANQRHREYQEVATKLTTEASQQRFLELTAETSTDRARVIRWELEETISRQKRMIGSLNDQLKESEDQTAKLRVQYQNRITEGQSEIAELREKRGTDMRKMKSILQKVKGDAKKKMELIGKLTDGQLNSTQKESSLAKEIQELQSLLTLKRDENLEQARTISELRDKPVSSGKAMGRSQTSQEESLQEKLRAATRQLASVKKQNKTYEVTLAESASEKEDCEDAISKLKKMLVHLKRENDSLKKGVSKIDVSAQFPTTSTLSDHVDERQSTVGETESERKGVSGDEGRVRIIQLEHDNEMLRNRIGQLEGRHVPTKYAG